MFKYPFKEQQNAKENNTEHNDRRSNSACLGKKEKRYTGIKNQHFVVTVFA